jgi:hypothetical protein
MTAELPGIDVLQVLTRFALRPRAVRGRDGLHVALAQQHQVLTLELDLQPGRGEEEDAVALGGHSHVGADERDVAPLKPSWGGHRGGGDQQTGGGATLAVLGNSDDEPVAGETHVRLDHLPASARLPLARGRGRGVGCRGTRHPSSVASTGGAGESGYHASP